MLSSVLTNQCPYVDNREKRHAEMSQKLLELQESFVDDIVRIALYRTNKQLGLTILMSLCLCVRATDFTL